MDWLSALDADPAALRTWVRSRPDHHRLGHHFAALLEFWLRFCPAIAAEKVVTRQEVVAPAGPVGSPAESSGGSPEESPAGRQAEPSPMDRASKLKFLVRAKAEAMHIEAGIHFSLARGLREVDVVASRFSGGFLHESLCWRVLEARNRIRLASEPAVAAWLREELGAEPRSLCLLRGYVFYELQLLEELEALQGATATAPLEAWRHEADRPLPAEAASWRLLSPRHAVGWWVRDPAELLTPRRAASRWVVLEHKRYWFSRTVAAEEQGRVWLEGDPVLRLRPLESVDGAGLRQALTGCRHLKARNPVLVAELRRAGPGRWTEASRGFVLPPGWSMEAAPDDKAGPGPALEEGASITQLQLSLERMLRAGGGLELWWREVDRLAEVAERTERLSAEVQEQRLMELWRPPPPERPLLPDDVVAEGRPPPGALAAALEARWPEAAADEVAMVEFRRAVLAHLAAAPSLAEVVIDGLGGLSCCPQQRMLGHLLLDATQRLLQRHGVVVLDRPLRAEAQALWDQFVAAALSPGGAVCPKLAAKACRVLNMLPSPVPREAALAALERQLEAFGYPGEPVLSTQREAALTGAVQLCALQLRVAGSPLLSEEEVQPWLSWLAAAGEASAAQALAHRDVCSWRGAEAEASRLLEATVGPKRPRRGGRAAASASGPGHPSRAGTLPRLRLMPGVTVQLVETGVAAVEAELFGLAAAEGGIVALDAEWQPFGRGEPATPVELLQLAVPSHCWLLDLPRLSRDEPQALQALLRRLTAGECVLLGFGLAHDLTRVAETMDIGVATRAVDLSSASGGLRELVRGRLGHQLGKEQQCSNWAMRPLSPEQLEYAALDAHVLLQLACDCGTLLHSPAEVADVLRRQTWPQARPLHPPLGPPDVDAALRTLGLPFRSAPEYEAPRDGQTSETDEASCKTMALVGEEPSADPPRVVALVRMNSRISIPRVCEASGVPGLRLAAQSELQQLFGYDAGALGPVGLRPPACIVVVDASLANVSELRVGGGQRGRAVIVPQAPLCAALGARFASITV